jgi:HEAT repeat protein
MAVEQGRQSGVIGAREAPERSDPTERDRAVLALFSQLSSGLSAYRLFPGDLGQPTFIQASERIRAAAERALKYGPAVVDIHGTRMRTEHGPIRGDDRIERLAMACYQRRAERLYIRDVPRPQDLAVLYEALSTPQSEASSGVAAALRVAGVRSIGVGEITPEFKEAEDLEEKPSSEQRKLWERLGDPQALARDLVAEQSSSSLPEIANGIFTRLKSMLASLPDRQAKGFELYRRLQEVIRHLPGQTRRALSAILLDRVREDPMAERVIGTMTDAQLARLLVDLGSDGGSEPVARAARLVELGVRRDDLVDLTLALTRGQVEGGTIIAGLDRVGITAPAEGPAKPTAGSPVLRTVSSLLARGLVSMSQDDVRSIREAFPSSGHDQRQLAFEALSDYLRIESDLDRLGEVLGVWVAETCDTLERRDEAHLDYLVRAARAACEDQPDAEKRTLVEVSIHRALSEDTLAELASVGDEESTVESAIRLLKAFGDVAVDRLLDDLARERDRGKRALLLRLLAGVARGHHRLVAKRLSDSRWYVARNAVTVLSRSGDPEAVPWLLEATHHREAAVRREAIRGLVAISGPKAINDLLLLAHDPDQSVRTTLIASLGTLVEAEACQGLAKLAVALRDNGERRRALDALAAHPDGSALGVLRDLGTSRARPRLPRKHRRYARGLVKRIEEGLR